MKGFLLSFRSEFYKSRKTLGFWGSIILPLVITLLAFTAIFVKSDSFANKPGMLLWIQFSMISLGSMGTLLLPIYTIFVAYSVNNVEHKADTWKTIFSLPISRWSVYGAKYAYAFFLLFICMSLFTLLNIGFGNLLGVLKPELKFGEFHMEKELAQVFFKLLLSALGILSIQFLLSLLWSDFLKPMGFGFVATIVGVTLASQQEPWKYTYLLPYSHPMAAIKSMVKNQHGPADRFEIAVFTQEVYVSLIVAVIVFFLGYYIVQKRSVK